MENLIITTSDTSMNLPPRTGWVTIHVAEHQIATVYQTEDVILADMLSPFNSATFSDKFFEEFEVEVTGATSLFSSDFFR